MALYKPMVQPDGVATSYHRILFVQITTNRQNSIAVLSYVDENSRNGEESGQPIKPYQASTTYETEYCPTMSTELAYEYLKTLPEFEGATDV